MNQSLPTLYIPNNNFLSEEEMIKRKYAYYGEFLVLKNFDDGWEENLYERFQNFHKQYDKSGLSFEVFDEKIKKSGNIKLILSIDKTSEQSEEKLIKLTTKLQKDFLMTPIVQNVNFGFTEESVLPITLEEPIKSNKRHHRFMLQQEYAKIMFLESEIKRIEYTLNYLSNIKSEAVQLQIESIAKVKDQNIKLISELKQKVSELVTQYYYERSLTTFGTTANSQLTNFQAEAVLELGEKDTNETIVDWLSRIEEVAEGNAKQMVNFRKEIDNLLSSQGIEKFTTEGVLSHCEFNDNNYLMKAQIAGATKSNVYSLDSKIYGFNVDGIEGNDIKSIKKIGSVDDRYLRIFRLTTISSKESIFEIKNGKYIKTIIEGETDFYEIRIPKVSECGKTILYGRYKFNKGDSEKYFHNIDGKYTEVMVNGMPVPGTIDDKQIRYGSKREIICGRVDSQEGQLYFYKQDQGLVYFELGGKDVFKKITLSDFHHGKPEYGKVEHIKGGISLFYDKSENEFGYLKIDGEYIFESTSSYSEGYSYDTTIWKIKSHDGFYSLVYRKNKLLKIFEINGIQKFYKISVNQSSRRTKSVSITFKDSLKEKEYTIEDGDFESAKKKKWGWVEKLERKMT